MNDEAAHYEPYDLAELLRDSDLSAEDRRVVFDVIVSGVIEGDIPSRESVLRLIELAAGRITGAHYRQQVMGGRAK
ncbi:hypothetical protein [Mycolicibacterium phocaicum]|uniref:Uncharacterized protein n=1 Tax=Mycolicibacterium phocaicum TaxID=319706 RepID=A0A7I7ZR23_9MYCO|nr:hypothetical protein [Mycolicibacterium phocaicum]TLH58421.1 hypothetical protein C1S79_27550 [Mycolicibacterium phocaicum]BBZ56695.1 hypothetical protein MPHO_36870 [Mycolicibacterium phocaicum]